MVTGRRVIASHRRGNCPNVIAHAAIRRVTEAIVSGKTYVIDLDLRSYFDTVRHHVVLEKVARRVRDDEVFWLLRLLLKASGKQGVPQGGVISPLLSNVYLNEVDKMLERAKEVTRRGHRVGVEYARFAYDLVIPRRSSLRGCEKPGRLCFRGLLVEVCLSFGGGCLPGSIQIYQIS